MEKSVKILNGGTSPVDANRLPDWGPQDPVKRGLETVGDAAQCRS